MLIAGGGPAGTALACALASAYPRLSIAVADSAPPLSPGPLVAPQAPPEPRVLALAPAARSLLSRAGAWQALEATGRLAPFYSMAVWDASSPGRTFFEAAAAGRSELGLVAEAGLLRRALAMRASELSNVALMVADDGVTHLTLPGDESQAGPAVVRLAKTGEVEAELVVACDGAGSPVARMAGLGARRGWKYDQHGLVCALRLAPGQICSTAFQRFLPSGGILAVLPMYDEFVSIVWSTHPEHVRQLKQLSDDEFMIQLRRALLEPVVRSSVLASLAERCLSGIDLQTPQPPELEALASERLSFPLQTSQATRYVRHRVALLGDAAHTVHPMAGQGFNLALADVACLEKCLANAIETGQDLGSSLVLEEYQTERKRENAVAMAGIDTLHKIFQVGWEPFVLARGLGMLAVDKIGPLKSMLISKAVGKD